MSMYNPIHNDIIQPLRIGLDLDGVLADFKQGLVDYARDKEFDFFEHGTVWNNYYPVKYDMMEIIGGLPKNEEFWLGLSPCHRGYLTFKPSVYITSRRVDNAISLRWLQKWGYPTDDVPIVSTDGKKSEAVREHELDIFVDDAIHHVQDIGTDTSCLPLLMLTSVTAREHLLMPRPYKTEKNNYQAVSSLADIPELVKHKAIYE